MTPILVRVLRRWVTSRQLWMELKCRLVVVTIRMPAMGVAAEEVVTAEGAVDVDKSQNAHWCLRCFLIPNPRD
jgi:hypothetical protein